WRWRVIEKPTFVGVNADADGTWITCNAGASRHCGCMAIAVPQAGADGEVLALETVAAPADPVANQCGRVHLRVLLRSKQRRGPFVARQGFAAKSEQESIRGSAGVEVAGDRYRRGL